MCRIDRPPRAVENASVGDAISWRSGSHWSMMGRDRILKALALEQPDRVPIFELGFNESSIVKLGRFLFGDVVAPDRDFPDLAPDEAVQLVDLLCSIVETLDLDAISTVFLTGRRRLRD